MNFADNYWFLIFIFLSILVHVWQRIYNKKKKLALKNWAQNAESLNLIKRPHKKVQFLKKILLSLATLFLCIALARPQRGEYLEKHFQVGVNVLFALDTSKSMLATDVRPNRLELAKISIEELIHSLDGSQIGLIAFAGDAFLQCPSTNDYGAFKLALRAIDTKIIARGGTNIASALELGEKIFDKQAKHKHLLLLTDGEDLTGKAIECANRIAKQGVIVHTVGIGSVQGSAIAIRNDQGQIEYVKDQNGKAVISRLDEKTLQSIAQITHGIYTHLGNAGEGLKQIYNLSLQHLPKEKFEETERIPIDRFTIFAALAALCLTLESLLVLYYRKK